jgi:hypothetical protein
MPRDEEREMDRLDSNPWFAGRCRSWLLAVAAIAALAPAPAIAGEAPPEPAICRGPGFWGTHAGSEKGGVNIVEALLAEVGCLEVCGEVIDDTALNSADSAEEGLCLSPKAGPQLQLARLLLTQALNCVISTGDPACDPEAWAVCNAACVAGDDPETIGVCREYLDCQASGGTYDFGAGACQIGTCELLLAEGDGGIPCGPGYPACAEGYACVPTVGCDDAALVNGDLGLDFSDEEINASSSKKCNNASKTKCTIVGPNETLCTDPDGNESEGPESCNECTEGLICDFTEPVNCQGSELGGCVCFNTSDGDPACLQDAACGGLTFCASSADCGEGEVCAVDQCCPLPGGAFVGVCLSTGSEEVCTESGAPRSGRSGLGAATAASRSRR